ncbi:MAG: aminoglycoside 6-adenylyltransferase [Chlamydiales bacterium]|nr:aminoglycoside 6-adenylyltransferase [Chlamydiales bacterium]
MDIIQKIVRWSENEAPIKALILQGSRAEKTPTDEFSDYDISVFCSSSKPYTETEEWLTQIGQVWVCVKEKIFFNQQTFPTRLVIFEGGIKVDFSFLSLDCLNQMIKGLLPDEYNRGYQILLDKDHMTQGLQKPIHKEPKGKKPSKEKFLRTIEEFWFEAYHVAIYLRREDLWSVKFRSGAMNTFLLALIEWEAQSRNEWNGSVPPIGRRMASWTLPSVWKELQGVFAHFDVEDSWQTLLHTMALFRRLSIDLSHQLGLDYPEALDKNISRFIVKLREERRC